MALTDNIGIPSKLGVLKLPDSSGTLHSFHCKSQEVGRESGRAMQVDETYCGIAKAPGSLNRRYSGRFLWDGASGSVDEILQGIEDFSSPLAYEWNPAGEVAGQPKYVGSGYLTSWRIAARVPGSALVDVVWDSVSEERTLNS